MISYCIKGSGELFFHRFVFTIVICIFVCLALKAEVANTSPTLVTQSSENRVAGLAFSPNGKYLVATYWDGAVLLWDVPSLGILYRLTGPTAPGGKSNAAFSTDSRYFAAGYDDLLVVWESSTGKLKKEIETGDLITCFVFSPQGTLFTSHSNGLIRCWDIQTGKMISEIQPDQGWTRAICCDSEGKRVFYGTDKGISVWNIATNEKKQIASFDLSVFRLALSPDERQLVYGDSYRMSTINLADGKMILRNIKVGIICGLVFSRNGDSIIVAGENSGCYDAITGRVRAQYEQFGCRIVNPVTGETVLPPPPMFFDMTVTINDAGSLLAWGGEGGVEITTYSNYIATSIQLGANQNFNRSIWWNSDDIYTSDIYIDSHINIISWNLRTGRAGRIPDKEIHSISPDSQRYVSKVGSKFAIKDFGDANVNIELPGDYAQCFYPYFNKQCSYLALSSEDPAIHEGIITVFDAQTGKIVWSYRSGGKDRASIVQFSPDGNVLVIRCGNTYYAWDYLKGKQISMFGTDVNTSIKTALTDVHNRMATFDERTMSAKIWDVSTGSLLNKVSIGEHNFKCSQDGNTIAQKDDKGRIFFLNMSDRPYSKMKELSPPNVDGTDRYYYLLESVRISPDNKLASVINRKLNTVEIFSFAIMDKVTVLENNPSGMIGTEFSPDSRYIVSCYQNDGIRIWEALTGKLICSLHSFDDGTWAVIDPQGRYDASNAGDISGLRWTIGGESVALRQLKARYYEPNLLAKLLGYNDEPLREVAGLETVKLFPAVEVTPPAAGTSTLGIKLTNREGGIGEVQVLVNGKELLADARGERPDPGAATATLTVDLAQSSAVQPGQENLIEVIAANADGTLTSRSMALPWVAPGVKVRRAPACYALIIGTSDYAGDTLDLRYPAHDATTFAQAVRLGAERLFGTADTHVTLLSTGGERPTKAAIKAAFMQIARQAKPEDVLLVYLAGHGASLGRGQDTYCYLTCEARSVLDLTDTVRLGLVAITSAELQQWCTRIPALKQVMILDTCAAGAAADTLLLRRDISGDQIRAIERLKDRTGLHVLMGCAADAKSYEASRYGQGVLTYSLLQGMKGAALRAQKFVDIGTLFAYATDQVPMLAANLGGVQRPLVMAPRGNSFDIGALNGEDRAKIPLSVAKPLVGRPALLNPATVGDPLQLTASWQTDLRQRSDANGTWVWVDSDDFPDAYFPQGIYTVAGKVITLRLTLWHDGVAQPLTPLIGDTDDLPALLQAMDAALANGIKN